jgi:glycosyltransferase involved in cell wall biosynthesis
MAGLPVACSDFPFLRGVALGDGAGTVFDPASPASIAEGVARILAAPEGYREHVAAVRERYSWEREERRLLELYASLPGA